jgi:hypothetical protein
VPAFSNAPCNLLVKLSRYQVRLMSNLLKKFLAVLIVAAVAAPAVSYAKPHHHHKFPKAKHVTHTAH